MSTWWYLILIAMAFGSSLLLTRLSRQLGHRWALMDQPGHRKIHQLPIPSTGGMGITWTFVILTSAGLAVSWLVPRETWTNISPEVATHLDGIHLQTVFAICFLSGILLLHGLGVIDDRKNLGPWIKLVAQIAVAAWMVIAFNVRLLELLGPTGSIIVSILWFVVIINAFNFLDNMDGLSAGIATVCSVMLLLTAIYSGQWFIAAILSILIGSLIGFLVFNFPPASIFMGDGGSLVVGFIIAFCSVRITYIDPEFAAENAFKNAWWSVLSPMVILAIPLYDFTSVTIIRILQGKSPFQGDTQHFSHRLVKKGLSRRAAVGVIWACALATGLGGVVLPFITKVEFAILIFVQTLTILLVLALLEYKTPSESGRV